MEPAISRDEWSAMHMLLVRLLDDTITNTTATTVLSSNETANTTSNNSSNPKDTDLHDSDILLDTFVLYGSILVITWLLFCWARLQFPRPFTVRNWTTNEDLKVCRTEKVGLETSPWSIMICRILQGRWAVVVTYKKRLSISFPFITESFCSQPVWFLFVDVETSFDWRWNAGVVQHGCFVSTADAAVWLQIVCGWDFKLLLALSLVFSSPIRHENERCHGPRG